MKPAIFDGWIKRDGIELTYPLNALPAYLVPGAAANTFGPYITLRAAAGAPEFVPTALQYGFLIEPYIYSTIGAWIEIELYYGVADTLFARFVDAYQQINFYSIGGQQTAHCATLPIGPIIIPAGQQIRARIRQSVATASVLLYMSLYLDGYQNDKVPIMYKPYSRRTHIAGIHRAESRTATWIAPVAFNVPVAAWGFTAWQTLIAVAASDLIITGVGAMNNAIAGNQGYYAQIGTGAAPNEVARAQVGLAVGGTAAQGRVCGFYRLRSPLLVKISERVAVRIAGSPAFASIVYIILGYEEL